ncbi:MAG: 2-oxoglutarate dehydrogenase E1 component [Geobacteraceae bacterium GWB2_52_12]|nr:MAG: 2-oxoglutarate dehydrogenase E1 component [Geobacteraceae bacterium GWB2_52_12]
MNRSTKSAFIANLSGTWIESLYDEWRRNPATVPEDWKVFFNGFDLGYSSEISDSGMTQEQILKHSAVQSLIYRYRDIGHLLACTDPLSACQLSHPLLALDAFGLNDSDLDTVFATRRFMKTTAPLREIVSTLHETYCRSIGVEFMHIQDPNERQWLIDRMEPCRNITPFSVDEKLHILGKLQEATQFELFLHRRFAAQKRFSLEGGEILIPVLDAVVQRSPGHSIKHVVIGMAHRGRLNVLANIFSKPYENIFAEFRETTGAGVPMDGDVKYHRGHSRDMVVGDHTVHLALSANPSHLEAVNPVVEGKCRALQDRLGADGALQVLPLLIHGETAFAGQGSVMETFNMSRLEGYGTGGTIHIVLNNQIGFTTLPKDARSTLYSTDVAKMLACPVFHVQGESPEVAVHIVQLALDYRQTFGRDVVVELICYRRRGHNEGDEPAFTQSLMYRQIGVRPPASALYADMLAGEGIAPDVLRGIEKNIGDRLEAADAKQPLAQESGFQECWSSIDRHYQRIQVETGVSAEKLQHLAYRLAEVPVGFSLHPKISSLLQKRRDSVVNGTGIDWGTAESMAYATLLDEGVAVRLSGQDSRRGTFNHRHAVLHDVNSDNIFIPLAEVAVKGAVFQAWNSLLSEFAVLGFEYGYSLKSPQGLVIWEAQFGDFANGAQVIIDQFISSGETKWNRASGLVLLLPHGYEGQGAEHSSARIERYLQLCARENMLVVNPSTPAQMFHLLRRQIKQPFRKPLIVFTPKSLLRHPRCTSTRDDLSSGSFSEVIVDVVDTADVQRVMVCSGKIFYELLDEREKRNAKGVAIIRIEQLHPFRDDLLTSALGQFPSDADVVWVQEEPENMGPLPYLRQRLSACCNIVRFVSRPEDCIPATGSHRQHEKEQTDIINSAFG